MGERCAHPRCEPEQHEPARADRQRERPRVEGELVRPAGDLWKRAVRQHPPVQREGDAPEGHSPDHDGDHEADEPGDEEQQHPGGVPPGLRIDRERLEPRKGSRPLRRARNGISDGTPEDEGRSSPLDPREPAVGVHGRDQHGDPDQGDQQRDAGRHPRDDHGEGDDAGGEAGEEVRELRPGPQPNRPERDLAGGHDPTVRGS